MKTLGPSRSGTSKGLRTSIIDGFFAAGSDNIVAPYVGLFALSLGATAGHVGLLTALPSLLGNIMQIPYAMLSDWLGRRKLICMLGGIGGRLIWVLAALIPFAVLGEKGIWPFIIFVTVRGLLLTMGAPAWTALMADIIPRRIRGRYFATRNIWASVSALGATLLAGALVRVYGFPYGYQIIFVLSAVLGLVSLFFFAMISDPADKKKNVSELGQIATEAVVEESEAGTKKLSVRELWAQNPTFRKYSSSSFFWNLAVSLPAPLFVVHFRNNLMGAPEMWSLVTAASLTTTIIGQRYWGKRADWYGNKAVMKLSGLGSAALPLFWTVIPIPEIAIAINLFSGFVWAGYNLAAFNLILELTPEKQRASYIGIYNTIAGVAASLGPMIGGFAAEWVGTIPVFAVSGVLRYTSLFIFWKTVHVDREDVDLRDLLPGSHGIKAKEA